MDSFTFEMKPFRVAANDFVKKGDNWELSENFQDTFIPELFIRKTFGNGGKAEIVEFSDAEFSKKIITSLGFKGGGKKHRKSMKRIKQLRK